MRAMYIQRGEVIDYKNETLANISAGDVVTLSSRIGVATTDIPVGAIGSVSLSGIYEIDAESTTAFTTGQKIYFASGKLTATAGAVEAGFAIATKATAVVRARVKIG